MDNKELTDRLELILDCLVGSCTSNLTGEDQLDNLITELKAKHNEVLGNVVFCRGCGSKDTYKCKITDVIVCKECGYQD